MAISNYRKRKLKYIGLAIKLRRWELGLTQKEVADACFFSAPWLSMIENGDKTVTPDNLLAISKALDCAASDFLRDAQWLKNRRSIDVPVDES